MKKAIRPRGGLFGGALAALALTVLSAPYALAQDNSGGVSVINKTVPSNPPAAAPAPQAEPPAAPPPQAAEPAAAPAEPEAKPSVQAAAPVPNAVGAGGAGWDAQFGVAPPQTSQFTGAPEQVEIINKINAYFNNLKNLRRRVPADRRRRQA